MNHRVSQDIHEKIIRYLSDVLHGKRYRDVRADLPGFDLPPRITFSDSERGHVPDLTAESDRFNIFEVETADTIDDRHTAEQWPLFAGFAERHNGLFWLIIPPGTEPAAKRRLQQLNITALVCEVPEGVIKRQLKGRPSTHNQEQNRH